MTSTLPRPTPARATAEEALVADNLPLVGYLVAEIIGRVPAHVRRDDLMSAGLAALAYAARAFDPERGVPFGRFATNRIRGAIIDELRSHDWASRSVRSRARRRDAAADELARTLGRSPTSAEVAAHLGLDVAAVDAMEEDVQRAVVLSLQGFADSGMLDDITPMGDCGAEDRVVLNERIGYLHDAIAVLPERLRTVVVEYFFRERPMTEIAVALGVTESRVSQMRGEALALLRDGMNAHLEPRRDSGVAPSEGCAARRRASYFAAVGARSDFRTRISARPLHVPLAAQSA